MEYQGAERSLLDYSKVSRSIRAQGFSLRTVNLKSKLYRDLTILSGVDYMFYIPMDIRAVFP